MYILKDIFLNLFYYYQLKKYILLLFMIYIYILFMERKEKKCFNF